MAETDATGPVPPYVSFTTIRHLIERMEQQGVPGRIDNSYLIGMSGGTQAQVKHALRSLGLIDEDGLVNPRLVELVKHPDDRPKLVGELLRERYPQLTDLDQTATRGQLDEAIKSYGLTGATTRKAASFFIAAANYAGLPLSPHFPSSRPGAGGTGGSGAAPRKRATGKRKAGGDRSGSGTNGDDASPTAASYSTEVTIGEDTTLILTVKNPDPFKLSLADRDFIFELIDKMKAYGQRPNSGNTESGGSP